MLRRTKSQGARRKNVSDLRSDSTLGSTNTGIVVFEADDEAAAYHFFAVVPESLVPSDHGSGGGPALMSSNVGKLNVTPDSSTPLGLTAVTS